MRRQVAPQKQRRMMPMTLIKFWLGHGLANLDSRMTITT
jgi:hypothetical protein